MNGRIWVVLNNFQHKILASHPVNGMADSNFIWYKVWINTVITV